MNTIFKWVANLLFLYVILSFTFRPLSFWPGFTNVYVGYTVGVVGCLLIAFEYCRTKMFKYSFLYVLVTFANLLYDKSTNLGFVLSEGFSILMTGFLAYYVFNKDKDGSFRKVLLMLFSIITVIYTFQTFILLRTMPNLMSVSAMAANYDLCVPYFKMGLSPYAFPHAIPCLLPILIMVVRDKDYKMKYRILCGVFSFIVLFNIYMSGASGPMITCILVIVLSFLVVKGSVNSNIKRLVLVSIIMLPFLLSDTLQLAIVHTAGDFVGEDSRYMEKLIEIEAGIKGVTSNENDIEYRGQLKAKTFNAILSSPIWGVDDKSYGNHNALLDRWAEYGLLGFIPLMMYLLSLIKRTRMRMPSDVEVYYLIGAGSSFLLFFYKSMFEWYSIFVFTVILPLLSISLTYLKNK